MLRSVIEHDNKSAPAYMTVAVAAATGMGVVIDGNTAHFYEKSDRNFTGPSTGDLQRIDVGIGLCHYTLALDAQHISWRIQTEDPGLILPESVKYIASVAAEV